MKIYIPKALFSKYLFNEFAEFYYHEYGYNDNGFFPMAVMNHVYSSSRGRLKEERVDKYSKIIEQPEDPDVPPSIFGRELDIIADEDEFIKYLIKKTQEYPEVFEANRRGNEGIVLKRMIRCIFDIFDTENLFGKEKKT